MGSIKPDAPSRGDIVKKALISSVSIEEYLQNLQKEAQNYNGFNLITGSLEKLFFFSNQTMNIEELKPGVYVLSNALLNTPWPKAEWAKERFKEILTSENSTANDYFSLLTNSNTYPTEDLPETGLSKEMEKAVSPVFINTKDYGTRCSTVLQLFDDKTFYLEERTYDTETKDVESKQVYTQF
jgi:uncharacterized protein with NRDE domain